MAKLKPTLQDMESALGYGVDPFVGIDNIGHRCYSDLTPVIDDTYHQTEREYYNMQRARRSQGCAGVANTMLPARDERKTISGEDSTIIVWPSNFVGFYKFFVDIQYGFGLEMPFLFTETEASGVVSVAQLHPRPARNLTTVLNLPRELRDKIYEFALQGEMWRPDKWNYNFCRAIGDPTGIYFPFGDNCTLLRVSRETRREALPIAYRHAMFHLDDIDHLTRFLLAIGRVGRENIESLEFSWESEVDHELTWRKFPDSENNHLILPSWHVPACVQLLKQCKRLRSLHLKFESCLMTDVPKATFMSNAGISLLCSIRGVSDVEMSSYDGKPLDSHSVARWLRDQLAKT